jgi:AcrR family transcriptional regulator
MRVKTKAGYHHGDLRQTLIDASVDVITKDGLDALTLRSLAVKAGVSSGAPYHHFADRAELLAAIAQAGFQMLGEAMVAGGDAAGPEPSARLAAMGQAYVGFALAHAGHFRVMFRGDANPGVAASQSASSENTFDLLVQVIQDCQRAGTAPPGDPKPLLLTAWSAVHGLAMLWLDGTLSKRDMDPSVLVPLVANLITQMFSALAHEAGPASPAHTTHATP